MNFNFNPQFSERLYKISSRIVERAFLMGGYKVKYFEAERCNFVFPNGKKCFDENTLSPSVDCPICSGAGVTYKPPIDTLAIAIDRPNKPRRESLGVLYIDSIKLVVKADIPVKIIKFENTNGRSFFIRDKFQIYNSSNKVWHTVYVDSEPKDVWLAGVLYKSFEAKSHVVSTRIAEGNKDVQLSPVEEAMTSSQTIVQQNESEILSQIINSIVEDF